MQVLRGHTEAVRCLGYSPDGRCLATGSEDTTVRLWDLAAGGSPVQSLEHPAGVEALVFSPGGKLLLTGTDTGVVSIWDLAAKHRRTTETEHANGVRCLVQSADGEILVTVGWDSSPRVWMRGLQESQPLPALRQGGVVACARGEPVLAAGNRDGSIELHHLGTWELVGTLAGDSAIEALAWSPDGRLLASGHADGTVRLWDVAAGGVRAVLKGHDWVVYALAFTPDGGALLSGGADGTVRQWDVAAHSQRHCFRWHSRWVTCLAVAPDGMTAAAGSADASIVVWDLDES